MIDASAKASSSILFSAVLSFFKIAVRYMQHHIYSRNLLALYERREKSSGEAVLIDGRYPQLCIGELCEIILSFANFKVSSQGNWLLKFFIYPSSTIRRNTNLAQRRSEQNLNEHYVGGFL